MMDPKIFVNREEIETALKIVKNETPDINIREKLAADYIPAALIEIKKEQEIKRALYEKEVEKNVDSLRKAVGKLLMTYAQKNYVLWEWSWSYKLPLFPGHSKLEFFCFFSNSRETD